MIDILTFHVIKECLLTKCLLMKTNKLAKRLSKEEHEPNRYRKDWWVITITIQAKKYLSNVSTNIINIYRMPD